MLPSKVAAWFSGGLLDRRWCRESRRRFGFESPAGDLELPASSTWSNNVRRGVVRDAPRSVQASTSWDVSPISRVDVKEALSRKGRRNHRAVAEQLVGRFTSREDREAEKRLGLGRGHFASKVWQDYGRKMGKRVCGSCMGACCGALRDFIGRLVESEFLDAESQSPNVSVWLFVVLLLLMLFQDYSNAVRRLIWRFECWSAGMLCLPFFCFLLCLQKSRVLVLRKGGRRL